MLKTTCEKELVKYVVNNLDGDKITFVFTEIDGFKESEVNEAAVNLEMLGLWKVSIDVNINLQSTLYLTEISKEAIDKFQNQ